MGTTTASPGRSLVLQSFESKIYFVSSEKVSLTLMITMIMMIPDHNEHNDLDDHDNDDHVVEIVVHFSQIISMVLLKV